MPSTLIKKLKKTNLLRPILATLILFIPLYPKFPLKPIQGTYVSIRLDDIVVAIAILIWIIYQAIHKFPVLKLKISRLFLLYFLAITLSTIHAIFIFQTAPTHILLLHLLRRFEYMSLFFITISALKKINRIRFPYISLLIVTVLVCLYGYGQKYLAFPVVSTMNAEFAKGQILKMNYWARINSTFAGHYDLATFLNVALIIIAGITITTKKTITKISGSLVWLLAFSTLILTASRISIFALWGTIIVTLILLKKFIWIIPFSIIIFAGILSSQELNQRLLATLPATTRVKLEKKITRSIIPSPTPIKPPTRSTSPTPTPDPKKTQTKTPPTTPKPTIIRHKLPPKPIIDADAGVARSGQIRFNAEWPRAINAYKKNPISGTGLGSITLATDNDYLRLLGESGFLGFVSFGAIIVWFFIKTIPSIRKKVRTKTNQINIIFLGATLTFLANAIFIDVFEASKTAYMFWIMMGVYHQTLHHKND